jgi:hypothetical protein
MTDPYQRKKGRCYQAAALLLFVVETAPAINARRDGVLLWEF